MEKARRKTQVYLFLKFMIAETTFQVLLFDQQAFIIEIYNVKH